jgi:hypothetical protein
VQFGAQAWSRNLEHLWPAVTGAWHCMYTPGSAFVPDSRGSRSYPASIVMSFVTCVALKHHAQL